MTNKKKRAYFFAVISIITTTFLATKHLAFFGNEISFYINLIFVPFFNLAFWLGLCYTTNKLLNYFGYEEN